MAWSQRLLNYGEHLRTSGLQLEADFGWRNAQWLGLCTELKKKSQQPEKPTTGVISGGAGGIRTHGTLRFNWFRVFSPIVIFRQSQEDTLRRVILDFPGFLASHGKKSWVQMLRESGRFLACFHAVLARLQERRQEGRLLHNQWQYKSIGTHLRITNSNKGVQAHELWS